MDIDEEILALAGDDFGGSRRTSSKRKKPSRREVLEDLEEGEAFDDEDDSDLDEDEAALREIEQWGEDLMGDDEDRARLNAMTDLDREKFLADRADKRQAVLDRLELRNKVRGREGSKRRDALDKRASRKQSEKTKKSFQDLKRKRTEKSSKKSQRSDRDSLWENMGYSSQSEEEVEQVEHEDEYEEEEEERTAKPTKQPIDFEKMKELTVTRKELEEWAYADFFADTVIGCFVRIGLGYGPDKKPTYRVAIINDVVDYHRSYYIEKVITKKALQCSHGRAKKVFTMDVASNQPITQQEFDRYAKTLEVENEPMMGEKAYEQKMEYLRTARQYVFTSGELEKMIQAKQSLVKVPHNIALEKVQLKRNLDEALESGDQEQIRKLQEELVRLETITEQRKTVGSKIDIGIKPPPKDTPTRPLVKKEANSSPPKPRPKPKITPGWTSSITRLEEIVFADDPFLDQVVF